MKNASKTMNYYGESTLNGRVAELTNAQALLVSGGSVGDYWGVGDGSIGGPDSGCTTALTYGVIGGAIAGAAGGVKGAIAGFIGGLIAASPACE